MTENKNLKTIQIDVEKVKKDLTDFYFAFTIYNDMTTMRDLEEPIRKLAGMLLTSEQLQKVQEEAQRKINAAMEDDDDDVSDGISE